MGGGLKVEVEDELEGFIGVFAAELFWHGGDLGVADGIEGESFLDFAGFHFTDELDAFHFSGGGDEEADGEESGGDEIAVADAHPLGAKPFGREDYIRKFRTLTDGIITAREANRFIAAAENLQKLAAGELAALNVALPAGGLRAGKPGIF